MTDSNEETSKMDRTMDSIRPSDGAILRNEMSYLYGRDPSILAYGQRPGPSQESKKNLYSDYEIEESVCPDGSLEPETLAAQTVKVYLRLKPFPRKVKLTKEQEDAYQIVSPTTLLTKLPCLDSTTMSMKKSSQVETVCRKFTFTETFPAETTQLILFDRVIQPQMTEFLAGQNCIAMTYGTTNSGKSHTLQGSTSCPGIIPRSIEYVFTNINPKSSPCYKPYNNCDVMSLTTGERVTEIEMKTKILASIINDKNQYVNAYQQMQQLLEEESPQRSSQASDAQYLVWLSFAEIYNETIYDLLLNGCQKRRPPLKLATDNHGRAFIKGLRTVCVNSGSEAYQVLMAGQCNLKVAATALNSRSSRSHCIFTITLLKFYQENKPEQVEISRFSFCDLAGSERLKKTLNVGDRLREAQNINTSLLVLGRCLKSIYEGQILKQRNERVGPFRESKLTRLFQQALSGKESMTLIVNVNPLPNLYEETQNVLNFAAIAKKIIVQQKKAKRRKSVTRFSLVVAQSVKTETNWEDTELVSIAEQSTADIDEECSIVHDDYEELAIENEKLKREIASLKASNLRRDLQVRQEMAKNCEALMEKAEEEYKKKMKDAEIRAEDLFMEQLAKIEDYYKGKLASRKRKRVDDDDDEDEDDEDDDEALIEELQAENNRLVTENQAYKKAMKKLRKEKAEIESEKNTLSYESALNKEELERLKNLISVFENDLASNGDGFAYVIELKKEFEALRKKNKDLKSLLNDAKNDFIELTDDGREKEEKISQLEEQSVILTEKYEDLKEEYESANVLLNERSELLERLEAELECERQLRRTIEKKYNDLKNPMVSSTSSMNSTNSIIKQEALSTSIDYASASEGYAYNRSQDEVLLEIRDIPVQSDAEKLVDNLRKEIEHLNNEKAILNEKWSQSAEEVESLKEDLQTAKDHLDAITVQLEEMKKRRLSLPKVENQRHSSVEIVFDDAADEVQLSDGNTQTCSPIRNDQVIQTSFCGPSNVNRSLQTTLDGSEDAAELQEKLDVMKVDHDNLKVDYDIQIQRIEELMGELDSVREKLRILEEGTRGEDDLVLRLGAERVQLQQSLDEALQEKQSLLERVEALNSIRDEFEAEVKKNKMDLEEAKEEIGELRAAEKTHIANFDKLKEQFSSVRKNCDAEYNAEISELREELHRLEEADLSHKQAALDYTVKIMGLEDQLKAVSTLNDEISRLNLHLDKCKLEKDELKKELDGNCDKIKNLERQLEQSKSREKDKDDEIIGLQKAMKSQIPKVTDTSNRETEKQHKKLLQELTELRESLERAEKINNDLVIKVAKLEGRTENHAQAQEMMSMMKQNVEEQKLEIKDLKETNKQLISQLDEKDIEMENFKKNRDELIRMCEESDAKLREELKVTQREVRRYQELFTKQGMRQHDNDERKFRAPSDDRALKQKDNTKAKDETTSDDLSPKSNSSARRPRRGKKPAVAGTPSNENEIPVIELSGSESKRMTRRTTAAPSAPPSEKRPARRKKLFNPDESITDIPPEVVPPSPAASTRSLRTRRR